MASGYSCMSAQMFLGSFHRTLRAFLLNKNITIPTVRNGCFFAVSHIKFFAVVIWVYKESVRAFIFNDKQAGLLGIVLSASVVHMHIRQTPRIIRLNINPPF